MIRILVKGGQVVPRSVFLLFFLLLQSVSWRSLTWFWVRFRKIVFLSSLLQHWPSFRQCLNIDPSAQSGTKAQATLAEQAPIRQTPIFDNKFWFSTPIFEKKLPLSNSDFRKQTSIFQNTLPLVSNSHFRKQTPLFKLPFLKTNSHFQQDKHRFLKSNSNVLLSFRTYTRLGVIRE